LNRERLGLHVLQPPRVMHFERPIDVAACLAFGGTQARTENLCRLARMVRQHDERHSLSAGAEEGRDAALASRPQPEPPPCPENEGGHHQLRRNFGL